MAETKTQRTARARTTARATATRPRRPAARRPKTPVDRAAKLSEDVLQSIEDGQRAAIEAVQRFADTVDHALPALPRDEGPTRRRELVDSALEMADRLVHTQYDFTRKVIDSAGKSLSR
jgi:hypothetical protein